MPKVGPVDLYIYSIRIAMGIGCSNFGRKSSLVLVDWANFANCYLKLKLLIQNQYFFLMREKEQLLKIKTFLLL